MCRFPFPGAVGSLFLVALAGCASGPVDRTDEIVAAASSAATAPAGEAAETASPEKRVERPPEPEFRRPLAPDRTRPGPVAAGESRVMGESRSSGESRPTGDSRTADAPAPAKLVAQLNEATQELARLRAANAKLRTERAPAPAATPRTDPAEEKLVANIRSFAQFKQDLAGFLAEIDKVRAEDAALKAQLKDAALQVQQTRTDFARLEVELRAEKASRAEAEQAAAKLRDQLHAIARALTTAGLSLDKFAPGAESTARLETNEPRLRSSARAKAGLKHVVKDGDTLEKIAERYYGDPDKWRVISEANRGRLRLDGTLEPGMELDIPPK